uniref:RdRp n=1 Tax=viral metagenome TaxID=1070528 RepID=A0A2V0RC72_9ZZZZ
MRGALPVLQRQHVIKGVRKMIKAAKKLKGAYKHMDGVFSDDSEDALKCSLRYRIEILMSFQVELAARVPDGYPVQDPYKYLERKAKASDGKAKEADDRGLSWFFKIEARATRYVAGSLAEAGNEELLEITTLQATYYYWLAREIKEKRVPQPDEMPMKYRFSRWKSNGVPREISHTNKATSYDVIKPHEDIKSIGKVELLIRKSNKVIPVTGENVRFESRIHRKVGTRPQRFHNPVRSEQSRSRKDFSDELDEYADPALIMAHGCWDTNMLDLKRFGGKKGGTAGTRSIIAALDRVGELNLVRIPTPEPGDCMLTEVRESSDSGAMGSGLGAKKEKSVGMFGEVLQETFETLGKAKYIDASPYTCGGRERRNLTPMDGEDLRSRLVLCGDLVTALIGCTYAQPITASIMKERGEVRLGLKQDEMWYKRYLKEIHDTAFSRDLDISRSDQSLCEELIVGAFGILRSMFDEDDKRVDNHFFFMMSSALYKRVIIPGGHIVTIKRHGLPSGHPFTSLITSIAHWIAAQDIHKQLGVENYRMEQSGDDARYHYFSAWDMPKVDAYVSMAKERWGLTIKPGSQTTGKVMATAEGITPEFLAVRHIHGYPTRDLARTWDISLLPRRPRCSPTMQAIRMFYMDSNNPFLRRRWKSYIEYFCRMNVAAGRIFGWSDSQESKEVINRYMLTRALERPARVASGEIGRPRKQPWEKGKTPVIQLVMRQKKRPSVKSRILEWYREYNGGNVDAVDIKDDLMRRSMNILRHIRPADHPNCEEWFTCELSESIIAASTERDTATAGMKSIALYRRSNEISRSVLRREMEFMCLVKEYGGGIYGRKNEVE